MMGMGIRKETKCEDSIENGSKKSITKLVLVLTQIQLSHGTIQYKSLLPKSQHTHIHPPRPGWIIMWKTKNTYIAVCLFRSNSHGLSRFNVQLSG